MSKKRKSGEGTLRLRKDGRWEARIVVGYNDKGLPITKSTTANAKSSISTPTQEKNAKKGLPR